MQFSRIVLALLIATAVFGDERAEKRLLVSELLEAIDAKTLIREGVERHVAMMSTFFAEDGSTIELAPEPGVFEERLLARIDYDRYLDEVYGPLFEKQFTADELRLLAQFFRTGHGQKLAQLLPQLGIGGEKSVAILDHAADAAQKDLAREEAAKYPWRTTMADLRTLATAVEARATDTNEYPDVAFEELEALLAPTYILEMPKVDSWGTPFLYVADGEHYRFVSAGADRRFEWNARRLDETIGEPVFSDDLDADIIFQDGIFVQAPKEP